MLEKLNNLGFPILGTFTFFLIAAPSHAVTLGVYDFTGNTAAASSVAPNISLSSISAGAGVGINPLLNVGRITNFNNTGSNTLASAQGINEFFTFTLTPDAGFSVNLTSFTLDVSRGLLGRGPTVLYLTSSLDGFTNSVSSVNVPTGLVPQNTSFVIPGFGFDSITTPITFNIYGAGASGNIAAIRTLNLDNLTLGGDVSAVPYEFETGSGVLLFAGYFAVKRYLKNKAKAKA
ncbi:hypothetical protein Syn7502_00150 [Synechococcus sp. PCC 7502]|uniref:PFE-CTERM domain-containing protein n=1 Tax=Synechococcus sp. PCC 7502 TaxID=1173263 RepID=UPI00029FB37E|nr:hypothetical protein [Synechococcus sp. PCC 7502]AFY72319.1 hypothetical protein Syn7502_00150 [Synechococcus sp. PCC 7502]